MSSFLAAQISMQGTYQGRDAKVFHIMGRREVWVDTTQFHDVAEYLDGATANFTELTGTESFELISSSASDAAAGTGTRTVDVCFINSSYAIQCNTYTLNGVNAVPVGVLGAKMILWMEASDGGSSQVSVGNISLRLTGGGATHEYIKAGGNRSLSARFMVPDGYEALIPDWDTHSVRQSNDFRLRATVRTLDRSLGTRYIFQDTAFMAADSNGEHTLPFLKYPARAKIKVSTVPGGLNPINRADVSFCVILIAGS